MMRKLLLTTGLMLILALTAAGVSRAQERLPIAFGQWVEGSISDEATDVRYVFAGTQGQLILVEMIPRPGTFDLDPALVLRDSDGDILGSNNDFSYRSGLSMVVAELPSTEDYVILATRAGGRDGDSHGDYWLRVTPVQPLAAGSKVEITLTSDYEQRAPSVFVMRPAASGPLTLGFSQRPSPVFPGFEFSQWRDDDTPLSLLDVASTAGVTNATVAMNVEGGKIYALVISLSDYAYTETPEQATVTFGLN